MDEFKSMVDKEMFMLKLSDAKRSVLLRLMRYVYNIGYESGKNDRIVG